jgi:hypothetical protein
MGTLSISSPASLHADIAGSASETLWSFEFENILGSRPEPEVVIVRMHLNQTNTPPVAFDPARFQAGDVYVEGPPYGSWQVRATINTVQWASVPAAPTNLRVIS